MKKILEQFLGSCSINQLLYFVKLAKRHSKTDSHPMSVEMVTMQITSSLDKQGDFTKVPLK